MGKRMRRKREKKRRKNARQGKCEKMRREEGQGRDREQEGVFLEDLRRASGMGSFIKRTKLSMMEVQSGETPNHL